MNDIVYQIDDTKHTRALHLLNEIKQKAGNLTHEHEATGHVIEALAESVAHLLQTAQQVSVENPF
jgi:hypothetical protein